MAQTCGEWVKRNGLPSTVDRVVYYKNCTSAVYCNDEDKTKHTFDNQLPKVDICDGSTGGDDKVICPDPETLPKGSLFCNFKFPSDSMLEGYPIETDDWQTCQRTCWKNTSCAGWHWKGKTKSCALSTLRNKEDMKWAPGYMGGPRWNVDAGEIVTDPGSGDDSNNDTNNDSNNTNNNNSNNTTTTQSWDDWIREHKNAVIAVVLACILVTLLSSGAMAALVLM